MRRHFRQYLASAFAEESLVFWEYAEDYRRGHPSSTHPLVCVSGVEGSEVDTGVVAAAAVSVTETDVAETKRWAQYIYNVFIADGSPMQIAIPGEQKVAIEKGLNDSPSADLFLQTQMQLFNHLKFHIFPSFAQSPGYKKLLQSSIVHAKDKVSEMQRTYILLCASSVSYMRVL
jgi:hypothetical protein